MKLFVAVTSTFLLFSLNLNAEQKKVLSTEQKKVLSTEKKKPLSTEKKKVLSTEKKKPLSTEKGKISYSIGLSVGKNFKQQGLDVDLDVVLKGMEAGYLNKKPLLTDEQVRQTMTKFQKEMAAKREKQMKGEGKKNEKEGKAFLAENKKKKNVVTLASGLQYEVIKAGTGAIPKSDDTVITNYKGTLINGKEFDNSFKRGKPATFPVTGVIKGWTEALQLMKTGAKWKLFIPSSLAYGKKGAGRVIGPDATLIFEIELLEIKKK